MEVRKLNPPAAEMTHFSICAKAISHLYIVVPNIILRKIIFLVNAACFDKF